MIDPPVSTLQVTLEQFTDLLDRCQWQLYTFLRGIVGDDEQARDLMQDTFYDAWRTAQQGNPPFDHASEEETGMRRWLFHAAYNRACSALRRRRIISWLPLESFSQDACEECLFENQIAEGQAVHAALASLSPADASCLLLIVVHGFTAAEVSQIVGASPQAVAKRFARAKRRLRDAYLAQNIQPETRLHS
jgi:RNA polymerase sigma-70 factor (ECF subfamily)